MKKACVILIAAVMVLVSGCSEGENSIYGENADKIVATIEDPPDGAEDFFDIIYKDWYGEYAFFMSREGYTEEDNPDSAAQYRQSVLDTQTEEKITLWLASQVGISASTLTQEETDEIQESVEESWDSWCESYQSEAIELLGSDYTDQELYDKEFELFTAFMKENTGLDPEIFLLWEQSAVIQEKYLEYISENVITDEDVDDLVNETVATAKDKYENDIETFESTYTAFYIPEGTRCVQQIYVSISSDELNEVKAYRDDGDDEKADAILAEALEKVRFRIDEAYEKLENGESWADVQEEYNDDTNGNDVNYTVYPKSSTARPGIIEAVMSIEEPGQYSDIISTDAGFFIVCYVKDLVFDDEQMESLRSQAREYLATEKNYSEVEEFKEKYPYVIDYETLNIETDESDTDETSESESDTDE